MSKKLVAVFSATGVTKKAAEELAKKEGAELFEILPEIPYTKEDLDYTNQKSRSTVEMQDLSCRPAVKSMVSNMENYDIIYIGFPIWWGREPSIIDTFIDAYDFTGKTIVPFCTSGGSPVDGASERIKTLTEGKATVEQGIRF